jgi:hypothetical protein
VSLLEGETHSGYSSDASDCYIIDAPARSPAPAPLPVPSPISPPLLAALSTAAAVPTERTFTYIHDAVVDGLGSSDVMSDVVSSVMSDEDVGPVDDDVASKWGELRQARS